MQGGLHSHHCPPPRGTVEATSQGSQRWQWLWPAQAVSPQHKTSHPVTSTLRGFPVNSWSPWVPSWCGECGGHHCTLWSPLAEPRLNEHREMLACSISGEGHSGLQCIEIISLLLSPGRGAVCGQMVFLSDLVAVSSSLSCWVTVGAAGGSSGATTCSHRQEPVREPGLGGMWGEPGDGARA